ncbi:hypothetical protein FHS85_003644 [Rhodoligotrophos appendicifer]|uniref:DUF447 domain-containing protein n=1 Tax=Rhodoligotrophos appendicifer TaxID=987056 RepID=UPI0011864486|nr:DUF447 domain-containing protein [Rhodoligotrophos appendicifer]
MPMIRECVVTTSGLNGQVHIAPLGLIEDSDYWVIAPFRPSATLKNLEENPFAVANYVDDIRIIAGCLTGRRDWPTIEMPRFSVPRLQASLAHAEMAVVDVTDDPLRPRFRCKVLTVVTHAPFRGLNRAKAAVLELAILVSRIDMLPREKIEAEIAYLEIAVSKTAGPEEQQAWDWLMMRVEEKFPKESRGHGAPSF